MKLFFADIDVPLKTLVDSVPNWIAFLFLAALVLVVWNQGKKAFGLKPPLDDQLKQMVTTLRGEIHREKNSALKEFKLKLAPIVERVAKSESDIEEIQLDRQRKWEKLTTEIHGIATDVAYMRGIRKGEQA